MVWKKVGLWVGWHSMVCGGLKSGFPLLDFVVTIKSNHHLAPLVAVPQCHIHTSPKYLQQEGLHHCLGKPLPMLDHSVQALILPHNQSKPSLLQLEAISMHPNITGLAQQPSVQSCYGYASH